MKGWGRVMEVGGGWWEELGSQGTTEKRGLGGGWGGLGEG